MIKDRDLLLRQITENIAKTDFSGYTIQYPPMFSWSKIDDAMIRKYWLRLIKNNNVSQCGLYVHIPFCKTKCNFCRYFSVELKESSMVDDYLNYLNMEAGILKLSFNRTKIRTLYIGGGTPAILEYGQLLKLFKIIYEHFDLSRCVQICFEGNSEFLDYKKLRILKQSNVNRLTMGIQSLDRKVVKAANRTQDLKLVHKAYLNARRAGLEYINIDLMACLPHQTTESFLRDIEEVISWRPDMVHIHPFYPTPDTQFSEDGSILSKKDMDRREEMSYFGSKLLSSVGYKNIKLDAMGLDDKVRNVQLSDAIEYNAPYLGIGCGAVSHITGFARYANFNNLNKYYLSLTKNRLPILSGCKLNKKSEMIYFITACLKNGKVSKQRFFKLFHEDIDKIFPKEIEYLEERGIIVNNRSFILSRLRNIGEYLIFSKYFYENSIVKLMGEEFNSKARTNISDLESKYMCL